MRESTVEKLTEEKFDVILVLPEERIAPLQGGTWVETDRRLDVRVTVVPVPVVAAVTVIVAVIVIDLDLDHHVIADVTIAATAEDLAVTLTLREDKHRILAIATTTKINHNGIL